MNKSELKRIKSLFFDLNDRNSDNYLTDQLTEIKKSGYHQVNLELKESSSAETVKLQVEIDMFSRIKNIQDLPDWIIIKLILVDGKLKDSSFKNRFSNG